jgi:ABC-type oligopeptide transport system ATPase subunit
MNKKEIEKIAKELLREYTDKIFNMENADNITKAAVMSYTYALIHDLLQEIEEYELSE